MEELHDIKAMWKDLNNRVTVLEEENRRLARKVTTERYMSSVGNLIRRYRRFIFLELIMLLFIPLMIYNNPLSVEKYRLVTTIYWCGFFLIEIGIDFYLLIRVKDMDLNNYSVSKIARMASQNWKFHKIAIMIGLPLAIGALVLFALAMDANDFVIYGMFLGFVIGLVIGIRQLLKFRNEYRLLSTEE